MALTVRVATEMASRNPNIWKWLPLIALGLMLVGDLAPVSDSLDEILLWMAIAILLTFSGSHYWQEWQERRERRADHSNSDEISPGDQI